MYVVVNVLTRARVHITVFQLAFLCTEYASKQRSVPAGNCLISTPESSMKMSKTCHEWDHCVTRVTNYGISDENLLLVNCDDTRARDDGGAWARGGEAQRTEATAPPGRSKRRGGNLGTLSLPGQITIGDPIPI